MRVYAGAGFDLLPSLAAMGVPDLRRAPDAAGTVEDAGGGRARLVNEIGRELRGAGYAGDRRTVARARLAPARRRGPRGGLRAGGPTCSCWWRATRRPPPLRSGPRS